MEEWRDIEGFANYKISSCGRVMSCKFGKQKILATRLTSKGRPQACLTINNKSFQIFNHVLVANAFIPNPLNLQQVDHIDRNILNNNVTNLRWCSQEQNQFNTSKRKCNTSGFKCVYKYKYKDTIKWFSSFTANHKTIRSKTFDTPEEAYQWYLDNSALISFN